MHLSIIIINYNVKYYLEQCLYSVMKAAAGFRYEILVIDNASTDGSREYLENRFPQVSFTWNKINLGFAKANNMALAKAGGEFILFLNPDTILPEDCFLKCLAFMDHNPGTGALGLRMLDGSGRFLKESKRGFPTPLAALYKLTGLSTLFPKSPVFSHYHMGHLDPEKNHETDVLAGAFMLIRKSVLDQTGGFDEAFFMYGEDIDLSYRIRKAGFKNMYFSETPMIHFKGESTRKGTLNYVRLFYGAMAIFARKHYGSMSAGIFSFFIQAAIWARAFVSALAQLFRFLISGIHEFISPRKKTKDLTLIVGSLKNYQRICGILLNNAPGLSLPEHLNPDAETFSQQEAPEKWYEQINSLNPGEIIFCENGLSFKEIISLLSRIPASTHIRISANASSGWVGSEYSFGTAHKDR